MRVLLQGSVSSSSFSGATSASGKKLSPGSAYTVKHGPGANQVVVIASSGKVVKRVTGVLSVRGAKLRLGGVGTYRGALEYRASGFQGVQAVNALNMEDYVRGVVSRESPASWPAEALKAQAVAARTYALTTSKGGNGYDQYPDTRSQVYGGVAAETAATDAAVRDTAGEVVTYDGEPVTTYFFSTSGGRTESVENSVLGTEPLGWLKSVSDPYDDASPKHRWGPYKWTMGATASKLSGLVKGAFKGIDVTRRGDSPRIVTASIVGTGGRTTVSGGTLRARLGLYDSWAYFTSIKTGAAPKEPQDRRGIGLAPEARVPVIDPYRLSGEVHPAGAGGVVFVQRQGARGRWRTVGETSTDAAGRYAFDTDRAGPLPGPLPRGHRARGTNPQVNHADYEAHDAVGLAELVATKQVAASELLDAARARAEAVNPRINAIVRFIDPPATPEGGSFAGVPFLLKDLFQEVEGEITSNGCRALTNVRSAHTMTVVQRWLDAGLQIFGKTNTPEFGAKGVTEPLALGACRNPWNTDHSPGGSSGGAGAAVAAGIVPCAGASDGGGSIRHPAACCGLVGLKAGRGLIPSGPSVGEALHGSGVQGVVSRSVRDTAAMFDVLAGPDFGAPYAPARPERAFAEEVGMDPGRLRIGVGVDPVPGPEAQAALDATIAMLEGLGHSVETVPAPYDHQSLARDFLTPWFVNAAAAVEAVKTATGCGDEGFEEDTLIMAALGRATSSVALWRALEAKHAHTRRLAEFHRTHDLLLTPTLATPPPRIGAFDTPAHLQQAGKAIRKAGAAKLLKRAGVVDKMIDDNLSWVPYTQLANLTGRPAISLPLHRTPAGLPLGSQFVADLGGEGLLLRLAAQLEEAHPWFSARPPSFA